ncbi:TIM barrel protein [Paenibacillus pabuli]|uniref:TIM barrel protein n=1 Tax=Paenibacillus pabuli TaxID=1472 RepID=UPI003242D28D
MTYMRLKTDLSENSFNNRYNYNPEIMELHLNYADILDKTLLHQRIEQLQASGIDVYLHHPMTLPNGEMLDIMALEDEKYIAYLDNIQTMVETCKIYGIKCIVHAHYANTESSNHLSLEKTLEMRDKISDILSYGREYLLWEDTIEGLFSYDNPYLIEYLIKPLNLPLCQDISHSFIALKGDNEKLVNVTEAVKDHSQYFHVVDSMGETHDGLILGEGKINWKELKPYLEDKPFIFEIGLTAPYHDCSPMIESVNYFNSI